MNIIGFKKENQKMLLVSSETLFIWLTNYCKMYRYLPTVVYENSSLSMYFIFYESGITVVYHMYIVLFSHFFEKSWLSLVYI